MTPITQLKGVGVQVAQKLGKLGVHTIEDLLFHFPLRYQDRTRVRTIAELQSGAEALVDGVIDNVGVAYHRRRMLLIYVRDNTGVLLLRFFHFSNAQKNTLNVGRRLRVYGEARLSKEGLEMIHPEYRFAHSGNDNVGHVPIYPTTEGLHPPYRLR